MNPMPYQQSWSQNPQQAQYVQQNPQQPQQGVWNPSQVVDPFQLIVNTLGALPAPEIRSGYVLPFAPLQANAKETVNGKTHTLNELCAGDADDGEIYLMTSPKFRGKWLFFTPIFGTLRHVSWRNNQRVNELANSMGGQGLCNYCAQAQGFLATGSDNKDRCDTLCELVICALQGDYRDPSSMQPVGFYVVPAKSSAFDEIYNFFYWKVMQALQAGRKPWETSYMMSLQHIISKKTNYEWNVYRVVRRQDDVLGAKWAKDERGPDGAAQEPEYQSFPTPATVMADLNQRFMTPGSVEGQAVMLLARTQDDAAADIRRLIACRRQVMAPAPRPQLGPISQAASAVMQQAVPPSQVPLAQAGFLPPPTSAQVTTLPQVPVAPTVQQVTVAPQAPAAPQVPAAQTTFTPPAQYQHPPQAAPTQPAATSAPQQDTPPWTTSPTSAPEGEPAAASGVSAAAAPPVGPEALAQFLGQVS